MPDGAGYLLKRRTLADGRQEALVSYMEITPGPRGGLVPREDWLPLDRVQPLPNIDYSAVEHEQLTDDTTTAPTGQANASRRPTGWPAQVPAPDDDPGWATHAMAFLLDCIPPDYRVHEVVHDPLVLVRMATGHVDHALTALRAGYRAASVDLKPFLSPHAIEQVLEVYRSEGSRLNALAAAIPVVGRALCEHRPYQ
ncbi:hypothetical protein AB0F17_59780 [Nonomuraea sp. NPDC026600]|uniref:hypothetical protein n=1 Tax=Nonomuraea sp. NPDC026600 TaxID=3155363 RepID=UPI0033C6868E